MAGRSSGRWTNSDPGQGRGSLIYGRSCTSAPGPASCLPTMIHPPAHRKLGNLVELTSTLRLWRNSFSSTMPTQVSICGRDADATNSPPGHAHAHHHPPSRTQLGALTQLESDFALYYNQLSSSIPSQIGRLISITSGMYLPGNKLTGTLPTEYVGCGGVDVLPVMDAHHSNSLRS